MSALLRLQVAAQGFPFDDVVATRLVLESAVVDALATDPARSTAQARDVLDAMDADDLTPPEFLALDAQLHLALAEASGNVVIAAMMAGLRTAIESYVQAGAAGIAEWDAAADRLRREKLDSDGDDVKVTRRLVGMLEAESGFNDAPVVIAVVALTEIASGHDTPSP